MGRGRRQHRGGAWRGRGATWRALITLAGLTVTTGWMVSTAIGLYSAPRPVDAPATRAPVVSAPVRTPASAVAKDGQSGRADANAVLEATLAALRNEGGDAAFARLRAGGVDPGAGHMITHALGEAIRRAAPSVREAWTACADDFHRGCEHGVMEEELRRAGTAADPARPCREIAPTGGLERTVCVHGLGHGLHALHGRDAALARCDALPLEETTRCYDGVFMGELFTAMRSRDGSRSGDPLAACAALPDRYHGACYFEAPAMLIAVHGLPPAEAGARCRTLTGSARDACLDGFGRDARVVSGDDDARALQLCGAIGADLRGGCVAGMVRDLWDDPARAGRICERQPAEDRGGCESALGSVFALLHPSREAREGACATRGPVQAVACRKGAGL